MDVLCSSSDDRKSKPARKKKIDLHGSGYRTGNTPNAILGTAQADRPSIVLGGIDLRKRRVNYASGVVEWRMVHVAELLRSYEDTPICINPTEWEQEGLRERVWVQKSFRSAITQESAQARMSLETLKIDGDLAT
ncbi:hypothetical protein B0H14DRAFT_2587988 [Mycena olivaceomarginata]|nr:hypothetical protein B0H14DRAFT_2587988 [Mycena olivaceomarginata]